MISVAKFRRGVAKVLILLFQSLRKISYDLLSNNNIFGSPLKLQPVHAVGRGKIQCGENVTIGYFPSPFFLSSYAYLEARNPSASIIIGENTSINNNVSIISDSAGIFIGRDCLIGLNVEIIDSDFHALSPNDRQIGKQHQSKPVKIGDQVFIGSNVRILKGVQVGEGAVIANGAVVTKDIPVHSIAGGNPAKTIKHLNGSYNDS